MTFMPRVFQGDDGSVLVESEAGTQRFVVAYAGPVLASAGLDRNHAVTFDVMFAVAGPGLPIMFYQLDFEHARHRRFQEQAVAEEVANIWGWRHPSREGT